jgi:hypothetical protein
MKYHKELPKGGWWRSPSVNKGSRVWAKHPPPQPITLQEATHCILSYADVLTPFLIKYIFDQTLVSAVRVLRTQNLVPNKKMSRVRVDSPF